MSDNPYAPAVETSLPLESQQVSLLLIAKQTFLAWEKLRLVYLAVLVPFTLLLTGEALFQVEVFWLVIGGGVFANLCYFAGPLVETYVRWLGYQQRWPRWCLFITGTLFTMALAIVSLAVLQFPTPA